MSTILEGEPVWAGWAHIVNPCEDLDEPQFQTCVLDEASLSREHKEALDRVRRRAPILLPVSARGITLEAGVFQKLITAFGDHAPTDQRFVRLRRLLEVIDAGNRAGRFRIPIPHLPAPLPPAPASPFQHHKFKDMVAQQPLINAFINSLVKPATELESDAWWGRTMLSALLFGGLLQSRWLLAVPKALEKVDPQLRWLDLWIDAGSASQQPTLQRWLPDPLTRLLLVDGMRRGIPDMPLLNRVHSRQVMRLIGVYAKCAGFNTLLHRSFSSLSAASRTRMHLHLPPFLVQYALGQHDSTSLPEAAWQRLIDPPKTVASELIRSGKRNALPANLNSVEQDEDTEDIEAWPAQLRALATQVRKGEEGARERIQLWQQETESSLLPSIRRLAGWIYERLLKKGRGRRPLRIRTVYAMLNSIGGRLVGQLGNNDPATLQYADAYVELYQTALEDTASLAIRRRVARSLKSFHVFLVERHGVPDLEESTLFSVYGQSKGSVDANLIGIDTFFRALQWLHHTAKERHGDEVAQALCRIAGLGFFAGLRRSEAVGLKITDIEGTHHVDLLVRPNARRKLKTHSAQRVIPLSTLMPPEEFRRLLEWRDLYRKNSSSSDDLFYLASLDRTPTDTDPLMELVTEALQRATHDPGFRFHHLRHSFANWQLMKFWHAEQETNTDPLPEWFLYTEHEKSRWSIAEKERKAILGGSPTNRRSLMQVSRLLGHSTVDITLTHYIHLLDLLMGRTLRRMTPRLGTRALAVLTGYSDSHIRRLRSNVTSSTTQLDDSAADELDQCVERLLAEGAHGKRQKSRQPPVRVLEPPLLSLPKTFLDRLLRVTQVLGALADKPGGIDSISRYYVVSLTDIQRYVECANRLSPGIMQQERRVHDNTDSDLGLKFDLPKGPGQLDMARRTAETLNRLMHQGDTSGYQVRTVQKRLLEVVNIFVKRWQNESPLTVCIYAVPEAKKWLWFLGELGLETGVIVQHHPSNGKSARPKKDQKAYWEKALGIRIEGEPLDPISLDRASRGVVQIRVDLRRIPDEYLGHKKVTVLTGVRLILVMFLLLLDPDRGTPMLSEGVTDQCVK